MAGMSAQRTGAGDPHAPCRNPSSRGQADHLPEGSSVVKHVEKWAKVRGDGLAYRFLDFSVERDGVARDLLWAEFSARNKAVGARLQVAEPGDRIAILCPQNRVPDRVLPERCTAARSPSLLFDPSEPGRIGWLRRARRLPPGGHPHPPRPPPRACASSSAADPPISAPRHRGRRHHPGRGRRNLGHCPTSPTPTWPTCSTPRDHPDPHGVRSRTAAWPPTSCITESPGGRGGRPRCHLAAVLPRHGPGHPRCWHRCSATTPPS